MKSCLSCSCNGTSSICCLEASPLILRTILSKRCSGMRSSRKGMPNSSNISAAPCPPWVSVMKRLIPFSRSWLVSCIWATSRTLKRMKAMRLQRCSWMIRSWTRPPSCWAWTPPSWAPRCGAARCASNTPGASRCTRCHAPHRSFGMPCTASSRHCTKDSLSVWFNASTVHLVSGDKRRRRMTNGTRLASWTSMVLNACNGTPSSSCASTWPTNDCSSISLRTCWWPSRNSTSGKLCHGWASHCLIPLQSSRPSCRPSRPWMNIPSSWQKASRRLRMNHFARRRWKIPRKIHSGRKFFDL
mmetsp:Transcript_661/g.1377  ORF Transcript_661/g.1377 Transcript_661/m.1377 type:complete len:300 (-) Transcript_661:2083-2982(-)